MDKAKTVHKRKKANRDKLACESLKKDFAHGVDSFYARMHSKNPADKVKALAILFLPIVALIAICYRPKKEEKKFFFVFQ